MDNMMSDVKFMVNMIPVGNHVSHGSVQRRCVGLTRGVGRPRNLEGMMGMMVMVMVMVFYDGDDSAVFEGPDAKYFHLQPISGRHRRGERGSNWGVSRLALSSVVQWLICWILYFLFSFLLLLTLCRQQQQQ